MLPRTADARFSSPSSLDRACSRDLISRSGEERPFRPSVVGSIPTRVIRSRSKDSMRARCLAAADDAMGRATVEEQGGVHRFNAPRSDLPEVVDGVTLKPAFALGGWIAMAGTPANAMVMGDLVLTGAEVTPVITALQAGGVEQTAIHHHEIGRAHV